MGGKRAAMIAAITLTQLWLAGAQTNGTEEPVFDLGPGITPPRVVHQVNPAASSNSRGFKLSGTVLIGLVVSSKGAPLSVHVVRSLDADVDESAVKAVQEWRFEPARKDGNPVAVRVTVEIRFRDL
jgi:periplasmic protein TonB